MLCNDRVHSSHRIESIYILLNFHIVQQTIVRPVSSFQIGALEQKSARISVRALDTRKERLQVMLRLEPLSEIVSLTNSKCDIRSIEDLCS